MSTLANVSKRYGEVVALDDACFDVARGRILGFLGPNGAGKTTAMRCIFGLAEPDTGSIQLYAVVYAALGATVSRQEDLQSTLILPVIVMLPGFLLPQVAQSASAPRSSFAMPGK